MNLAQNQISTGQLGLGEQKTLAQMYGQQNQNQMYQQYISGAQQQQYVQQQPQLQQQASPQQATIYQQSQHSQQLTRKGNENQVLIEQQQPQYLMQQQDLSKQQIHYQKGGNQNNYQLAQQQNQQQAQMVLAQQQAPHIQKQYNQQGQQFNNSPDKMERLKAQSSPQQGRHQQYHNLAVGSPNSNNQVQAQHQKKHSNAHENILQNKQPLESNQQAISNNLAVFKPSQESQYNFVYSVPKLIEPNPLDCVLEADNELGGLFIGNLDAALSVEILKKSRIRAVLTTSVETGFRYAEESIHFHECLPAHDKEGYDITVHFEKGIEFIERNRKYTSVLVHCFAGVSRSASICIAYMMKKNRWNLEKALWHLKQRRRLINPNTGFIKKLTQYEQYLISKGHYNPQSNAYNNGELEPNGVDMLNGNIPMFDYGRFYSQQTGQIMAYNMDNQTDTTTNYSDPNYVYVYQQQPGQQQQQQQLQQQQQIMINPNQSVQQNQQGGGYDVMQPQFQQITPQQQSLATLQQQQYQLQQQSNVENGKQQQQPLSVIQQVNQLKMNQLQPKSTTGQQQQFSGQKQPPQQQESIAGQQQQQIGIQILANNEQFLQNQKLQDQMDTQYLMQQQQQKQQQQQLQGYQNQQMMYQHPQQSGQVQQQQQPYQQQSISQQVQNKQMLYKQQQQHSLQPQLNLQQI